ncbi:unnamed protein product [Rangifer tarandus platyrhynchus]|uniref:Uncharacterized protein n=1 Tax=Rangifer tarandus platyrhynchus TaxID=3082113 RepID=A0AC60A9I0_RANTA
MEWGLLFVTSSCEDCCSYPNPCVCDAHMETAFGRAHSQPGTLLRVLQASFPLVFPRIREVDSHLSHWMQVASAVQSHTAGECRTKTCTFISLTFNSRLLSAILNRQPRKQIILKLEGTSSMLSRFSHV